MAPVHFVTGTGKLACTNRRPGQQGAPAEAVRETAFREYPPDRRCKRCNRKLEILDERAAERAARG